MFLEFNYIFCVQGGLTALQSLKLNILHLLGEPVVKLICRHEIFSELGEPGFLLLIPLIGYSILGVRILCVTSLRILYDLSNNTRSVKTVVKIFDSYDQFTL